MTESPWIVAFAHPGGEIPALPSSPSAVSLPWMKYDDAKEVIDQGTLVFLAIWDDDEGHWLVRRKTLYAVQEDDDPHGVVDAMVGTKVQP